MQTHFDQLLPKIDRGVLLRCAGLGYKPETRKANGRCGGKASPMSAALEQLDAKELIFLNLLYKHASNQMFGWPDQTKWKSPIFSCLLNAHCPEQ